MKTMSLYLHIPFCRRKCFYCSFAVYIGKKKFIEAYLDAVMRECASYESFYLRTLYLGGGTPSFLDFRDLAKLMEVIKKKFSLQKDCEITIEASPEDVTQEKAGAFLSLGINRVSVGVQSFQDKYLKFLGRTHCAKDAREAVRRLRRSGFKNINADLMYGFPGQRLSDIKKDIDTLRALHCQHVSVYALTLEKNSRFYTEGLKLSDTFIQARQYAKVKNLLENAGFRQYEISNFAQQGKESRHNCAYWEGEEYIGLGPGAHSHLNGRRFWNESSLPKYLFRMKKEGNAQEGEERLSVYAQFLDCLLFGLRMNKGVNLHALEKRFKCTLDAKRRDMISAFLEEKLLTKIRAHLKATDRGQLLLDELCARLI